MPADRKPPKRKKSPWFAFYVDDFVSGTIAMTMAGRGAFVSLLAFQFSNGSIPADDRSICRIIGAFPDEWDAIKSEVLPKFNDDGNGGLVNERMEKERAEREGIRQSKVEAANKRWGKKDADEHACAYADGNADEYASASANTPLLHDASPSPSSATSLEDKSSNKSPLPPKGAKDKRPTASELIDLIPDDLDPTTKAAAERFAKARQSYIPASKRFGTAGAFTAQVERMRLYPVDVVAEAVDAAIAGEWKAWEQDNVKPKQIGKTRIEPAFSGDSF